MSDRTSAEIFSELFTILDEAAPGAPETANDPASNLLYEFIRILASRIWSLTWQYDFAHEQLCCDDALVRLGLARHAAPGREREYANRNGSLS